MRGDVEEQQFAGTRQKNLQCRSGAMRRRRLGDEGVDQRIELAEAAQSLTRDRARETRIARVESGAGQYLVEGGIERAALAQHLAQNFQRRRARGKARLAHPQGPGWRVWPICAA